MPRGRATRPSPARTKANSPAQQDQRAPHRGHPAEEVRRQKGRGRSLVLRRRDQEGRQRNQDAREKALVDREAAADARSARQVELDTRRKARDDHREAEQDRRDVEQGERERSGEMLIGMLSHDLRNPLSTIVMGTNLLMKGGTLSEKDTKTVARIARSAARMTRMIGQLLDLTRIRLGGGLVLKRQQINLNDVVEEVVDELRLIYGERDIAVVPSPGGPVEGSWDRDRIVELLSNLIANALQQSPASTPVVVALRHANGYVSLEVHNEGSPIPAELLPVIFDPFRSGRTRTEGLGLGLYIAKQLVEAHGGSMQVDSHRAEGTTFHVALPLGNQPVVKSP